MAEGPDSFRWERALLDARLLEQVGRARYKADTGPARVLASPFCERGFASSTRRWSLGSSQRPVTSNGPLASALLWHSLEERAPRRKAHGRLMQLNNL